MKIQKSSRWGWDADEGVGKELFLLLQEQPFRVSINLSKLMIGKAIFCLVFIVVILLYFRNMENKYFHAAEGAGLGIPKKVDWARLHAAENFEMSESLFGEGVTAVIENAVGDCLSIFSINPECMDVVKISSEDEKTARGGTSIEISKLANNQDGWLVLHLNSSALDLDNLSNDMLGLIDKVKARYNEDEDADLPSQRTFAVATIYSTIAHEMYHARQFVFDPDFFMTTMYVNARFSEGKASEAEYYTDLGERAARAMQARFLLEKSKTDVTAVSEKLGLLPDELAKAMKMLSDFVIEELRDISIFVKKLKDDPSAAENNVVKQFLQDIFNNLTEEQKEELLKEFPEIVLENQKNDLDTPPEIYYF